jgi:hypothetical protein
VYAELAKGFEEIFLRSTLYFVNVIRNDVATKYDQSEMIVTVASLSPESVA